MTAETARRSIATLLLAMLLVAGPVSVPARGDAGDGASQGQAEGAMPRHQGGRPDTAGGAGAPRNDAPPALLMPVMDPARGRKVFAIKGCVICHVINGVGGNHGPSLDMSGMGAMNPFDFSAKMWEGAAAMIVLQEEELGERISLTGQDLADMTAFVHSATEIAKFSIQDLPHRILDVLRKTHGEGHAH